MVEQLVLDEIEYWWEQAKNASKNRKRLQVTEAQWEHIKTLKQHARLWLWKNETTTFIGIPVEIIKETS
jgi:hypothetical protein